MSSPVLEVGQQFGGFDSPELFDTIFDRHEVVSVLGRISAVLKEDDLMDRIAALIEATPVVSNPTVQDLTDFDILTWGKRTRFIALVLGTDAIVLDWKRLSSSRIRLSNLSALPAIDVHRRSDDHPLAPPYTVENISRYFKDNEDNPFGVWNVILSMGMMMPPPKALTQFPPLSYSKAHQSDALDAMRNHMRPGDAIFTFDRSSFISKLIRKWDHCMWSHAIICGQGSDLYEATTSGTVKSSFDRLYDESLDVALYRAFDELNEAEQEQVVEFCDKRVGIKGYPWRRVIRIGLQINLGIPYRRKPQEKTGSDLMYSNVFRLICYA